MLAEAQEKNTSTTVVEGPDSLTFNQDLMGAGYDNVHLTNRQDGLAVTWGEPNTPNAAGVCKYII